MSALTCVLRDAREIKVCVECLTHQLSEGGERVLFQVLSAKCRGDRNVTKHTF